MTFCGKTLSRSLLGAKRTCLLHCICPLMTQSGHCGYGLSLGKLIVDAFSDVMPKLSDIKEALTVLIGSSLYIELLAN
jgi:hypothetical protein